MQNSMFNPLGTINLMKMARRKKKKSKKTYRRAARLRSEILTAPKPSAAAA